MKKLSLLAFILFLSFNIYSQQYVVEYKFTENGNTKDACTLWRSGDQIKIKGISKEGNTVTMWIDKSARTIHTLTENSAVRIGSVFNGFDCSYVGMQWGIYILDLDKCEFFTQSATNAGTADVLGKQCTIYNMMQQGDLRTDFYIYNNLMLKRTTPANTIEASSFNESPSFTGDEFTLPAGIEWMQ